MTLTSLERAVLDKMLAGSHPVLAILALAASLPLAVFALVEGPDPGIEGRVALAASTPGTSSPSRQREITREVLRWEPEFRRAVLDRDLDALMKFVPEEGLQCGDASIGKGETRVRLQSKGAWLHDYLFGEGDLRAAHPEAPCETSVRVFLKKRNPRPVVAGVVVTKGLVTACIRYGAKADGCTHEFCFERRADGRWYLDTAPVC